MKKTAKFTNQQRVHVLEHGQGTVIGYVGNSTPLVHVRVQFDSGDCRDFHENKLVQKLVPTIS
jgi:hypothetical protein